MQTYSSKSISFNAKLFYNYTIYTITLILFRVCDWRFLTRVNSSSLSTGSVPYPAFVSQRAKTNCIKRATREPDEEDDASAQVGKLVRR